MGISFIWNLDCLGFILKLLSLAALISFCTNALVPKTIQSEPIVNENLRIIY